MTVDIAVVIPHFPRMLEVSHLLQVIDAYRVATSVPDTTVSNRVFKDVKKVGALRAGGDMYTARYNFAMKWFSDHWPEGAEWPVGVLRP